MIKLPDTEGLQERTRVTEQVGPGPRLRAAREACGYEIDDIAKQMRLSPQIIIDLERDSVPEHLALVFYRGYLRAYAQILGLDSHQVVEEFNALGLQEDRELPDLKGRTQSKTKMRSQGEINKPSMAPGLKWAGILALAAGLGGLFVAYNREPEVQLNNIPLPPVSDSTEITAPPPEVQMGGVASQGPETLAPATTQTPTYQAAPNTLSRPATTTGQGTTGTAAGAAMTPEQNAQANPTPAAPPVRPSYHEDEDEDYDSDAMNQTEPELPKPQRSS